MNLSQNFIKLVSACGICIFIIACNTSQATQNSQTPVTPISNQTIAPPKSSPVIASSHGGQTETNAGSSLMWQLINGQTKNLAGYRGNVVVLDFWATYCPPCEEEIPHLVELSNKYPKDLHVVGLHVGGAEDKPNIAGFVSKYKMSYDLGYPDQDLMDFYLGGDDRIPQTFVFDRRGQLVQKFVGFTPEIKEQLNQAIQTAVLQ